MPVPHIPTPLDQLGPRPFSFYPPIRNLEHNEWLFRRAHWAEIQVMNTKSHQELYIPLRFLGGVSSIEEPVVIVGLVKDLEYREGVLVPHVQRVLEMPQSVARAVNDSPRPGIAASQPRRLAPVVGIRLENNEDSRQGRRFLGAVAAGILISIVGMVLFRDSPLSSRARFFSAPVRLSLPFTAKDDYLSVVERWGHPDASRSRREFHLLRYPARGLTIVLLGRDREHAFYVGALGRGGRVVHSVILPDGSDSSFLAGTAGTVH